jgi:uncharacterized phage protein (TIGR01671 family)
MRETKFRAWTGNSMEYSVGASKHGGFYCAPDPLDTASLKTTLYYEGVPIMQFTGLRDRNGKEIYEGDIVRLPICPLHGRGTDASRCIAWSDYKYTLTRIVNGKTETDYWLGYGDHEICPKSLEVIGNIYENAELLAK